MSSPAPDEPIAEFTLKAIVAGVLLGIVFGAANAYLGLRVGMTVSASIPAAVMTVAVFRVLRLRGTILEANLSQTIGSASTSLATGTIVAIAASKAGDISQDLKTGWLVGATPARQQLGQFIGASCACWAVAATVLLLGSAYTFGSREIPAPWVPCPGASC